MRSERQQIPAAKSCKCGARPVYFSIDGPAGLTFHYVKCLRCGKKVSSTSKYRAIVRWNEYINEFMAEVML